MNDADRRKSGRLMLISPERVFYAGLLGRPRRRIIGGLALYVSLGGAFTLAIDQQPAVTAEIASVPPYAPHIIESTHPSIICLAAEPETVAPESLQALAARPTGPDAAILLARVRAAYAGLQRDRRNGFTTAEFDAIFFGERLPGRNLDRRIAATLLRLNDVCGDAVTAAACAAEARLSPSRFLHLFKDETGVSFRAFRAWKRARHLLHFVNEDINLAHLAQDIGYPDSTHFSHSIRRFYGLQPRDIFTGSRDLAIYRSAPRPERAELRQGRS